MLHRGLQIRSFVAVVIGQAASSVQLARAGEGAVAGAASGELVPTDVKHAWYKLGEAALKRLMEPGESPFLPEYADIRRMCDHYHHPIYTRDPAAMAGRDCEERGRQAAIHTNYA